MLLDVLHKDAIKLDISSTYQAHAASELGRAPMGVGQQGACAKGPVDCITLFSTLVSIL